MIETRTMDYADCNPDWRDKISHLPGVITLSHQGIDYAATRRGGMIYAVRTDEGSHAAMFELMRMFMRGEVTIERG